MKKLLLMFVVLMVMAPLSAEVLYEDDYRDAANAEFFHGETNVYVSGQYLYCDIVATIEGVNYAIEVDYCTKNGEGIGQALIYGAYLQASPGLLLIADRASENTIQRRIEQTLYTVQQFGLNIKIWMIMPDMEIIPLN